MRTTHEPYLLTESDVLSIIDEDYRGCQIAFNRINQTYIAVDPATGMCLTHKTFSGVVDLVRDRRSFFARREPTYDPLRHARNAWGETDDGVPF